MDDAKLYRLLSVMTPKEVSHFQRFLKGNTQSRNSKLLNLLTCIKPYHPTFAPDKVKKEKVFRYVFPDKPFSIKVLTDLRSRLVLALEKYLVRQHIENDNNLFHQLKIEVFRERQLNIDFQQEVHQATEAMEAQEEDHWKHVQQLWEYYHLWYHQPVSNQYKVDARLILEKAQNNMELFQLLIGLSYGCEMLSMQKTFQEKQNYEFPPGLLVKAGKYKEENHIVELYYALIQLYQTAFRDQALAELFRLYKRAYHLFGQSEQRSFLLKLINLVNVQIQNDRPDLRGTCFEFFQFGVEEKILIIKGKIPASTFVNICATGAFNHEFSWTTAFIKRYETTLPETIRNSAKALGEAYIFIHQGEYEAANRSLNAVASNDLSYKIRVYSLSVRASLELFLKDEGENQYHKNSPERVLKSGLKNFRRYLNNNGLLSPEKKKAYYHLIEAIQYLVKMEKVQDNDQNKVEKITKYLSKIKALKPINSKKWLWDHAQKIAGRLLPAIHLTGTKLSDL